jgi:hypothetical protein
MTSTSIQHAIAQAQAASDAVTPDQGQIVPFGRPISLMDNLVGSFAVATIGMTIGKDTTTLFDKLPFRIDLSTVPSLAMMSSAAIRIGPHRSF